MSTSKLFTSETAAATIAQITDLAQGRPFITRDEVVAATGLSASSVDAYLRHLVRAGDMHRSTAPSWTQRGRPPTEYTIGAGPDFDVERDDDIRRVTVRKTWKPNHVRMAMECLLFGVPVAMQVAV